MSSATIQTWIGQNATQMANSAIARPFSIDPNWTTVQIGLWYSFTTGSLANITGTPRFYVGLCSGSNEIMGDPTTGHFVGYRSNTATFSYISSSLYQNVNIRYNAGQFIKKVGTTETVTSDPITSTLFSFLTVPNTIGEKSSIFYLQITRGSPNYTLKAYYNNSYTATYRGIITENEFLTNLQTNTPTAATTNPPQTYVASSTLTLAVDESVDGTFDHINIAWDREEPVGDMIVFGVGISVLG